MRQNLPHRNNIHSGLMKCKGFVRRSLDLAGYATFLPQRLRRADMPVRKFRIPNNGLDVSFLALGLVFPQTGMAGMLLRHDNTDVSAPRHGSQA
jgi:hypothetical protein